MMAGNTVAQYQKNYALNTANEKQPTNNDSGKAPKLSPVAAQMHTSRAELLFRDQQTARLPDSSG